MYTNINETTQNAFAILLGHLAHPFVPYHMYLISSLKSQT